MEEKNEFVTVAMFEEGIERLARIINASFVDLEKRLTDVEKGMVTKDDLHDVEVRLTRRINEVDDHLSKISSATRIYSASTTAG